MSKAKPISATKEDKVFSEPPGIGFRSPRPNERFWLSGHAEFRRCVTQTRVVNNVAAQREHFPIAEEVLRTVPIHHFPVLFFLAVSELNGTFAIPELVPLDHNEWPHCDNSLLEFPIMQWMTYEWCPECCAFTYRLESQNGAHGLPFDVPSTTLSHALAAMTINSADHPLVSEVKEFCTVPSQDSEPNCMTEYRHVQD